VVRQAFPFLVIAGLDPAIPANSGVCGDARIKSGHDEEGNTCRRTSLFLIPAMTNRGCTDVAPAFAKRAGAIRHHARPWASQPVKSG